MKPKNLFDETPGAVFVIKNTGYNDICMWPAVLGIRKWRGCVYFGRARDKYGNCLWLTNCTCDRVYGDHPARGEAWLVKPDGKYWLWERVDDQIGFSKD